MLANKKNAGLEHKLRPLSVALRLALNSVLALSLSIGTANSQDSAAQSEDSEQLLRQVDGLLEVVTVTGTRIKRDGYESPTPVTVLGGEELAAMAVTNVIDAVNRLPMLAPTQNTGSNPEGDMTGGMTNLDLRGLGPVRTLVLMEGRRLVGGSFSGFNNNGGSVDINMIPNGLVERVEVVTGGASAVYGSDAIAGVVNFVLDEDYTGVKVEALGGITTYGDNKSYLFSVSAGTPFAEGRGHFLFFGEASGSEGIPHRDRPWDDRSYSILNNPDFAPGNGEPQYITAFDTGLAVATPGGLVLSCPMTPGGGSTTACPLRGTQFVEGGTPLPFEFGRISGLLMQGGDWETSRTDNVGNLDEGVDRTNAFVRGSFELTDNTSIWAELLWSRTEAGPSIGVSQFHLGNVTVRSGNPFIPPSVQAQMTELGITQFTMGTTSADMPYFGHDNTRTMRLYAVGADGSFKFGENDWEWEAFAQRSTMNAAARTPGVEITANFNRATDTVVDPSSGRFVCAVNADTDPSNNDASCVPYNVMGIGVNSQAAIDYVTTVGWTNINMTQDVAGVSASGEHWSTWAGPISLAGGLGYRRESADTHSSELDQAGALFAGNFTESRGEYDVTEVFLETVVPLAADNFLAKSLDINGAVRWTDYSTSGDVITWKLGATWEPTEELLFRATQSRDIRAPNLAELFNAGTSGRSTIYDPVTNTNSAIVSRNQGNPNLQPEEADTTGFGVVYQPNWLPGFGTSIDYFKIDIDGAIINLSAQEYINLCVSGDAASCESIERNAAGNIVFVATRPANALVQSVSGIDFEASYSFQLSDLGLSWGGTIALRGMATYVDSVKTIDGNSKIEGAGVNADDGAIGSSRGLFMPKWRYLLSAAYTNDPFSATLMARGVDSGVYNNSLIQCTSGCPTATPERPTINNNHVDAVTYFDLTLSYNIMEGSGQIFLVTENLFNEPPPNIAGKASTGFYGGQANRDYYDSIGRIFRAGIRLEF